MEWSEQIFGSIGLAGTYTTSNSCINPYHRTQLSVIEGREIWAKTECFPNWERFPNWDIFTIREKIPDWEMFPTGKGFPRTRNGFLRTQNGFPRTRNAFLTGKGFPTEISLLSGKRFLTGKCLPPWRGFPIEKCFITEKVSQLGKVSRSRYSLLMVNLWQRARSWKWANSSQNPQKRETFPRWNNGE